ncbi:hypothetical protein MCB86_08775 [Pseudomonas sp. KSR10]|uniref:hypothetical protein n=1 Tax=Pseudomonas sp. KSR10 TaxID=2916654 RepID=UPI001EF9A282|nr:hypothetical protein [Pseudomonas sp. KSR10]MCG6540168.1 hypothetical protein [Pseudomonas sp. KSR10]
MLKFFTIALTVLLSACATSATPESEAKPIPSTRVYEPQFVTPAEGLSEVVFLRDTGMTGAACDLLVYVDNTRAFTARPGEGITVYLKPGEHFVRMELGEGLCPKASMSKDIELSWGESRVYRLGFEAYSGARLVRLR